MSDSIRAISDKHFLWFSKNEVWDVPDIHSYEASTASYSILSAAGL
jgi:hypothetical protein